MHRTRTHFIILGIFLAGVGAPLFADMDKDPTISSSSVLQPSESKQTFIKDMTLPLKPELAQFIKNNSSNVLGSNQLFEIRGNNFVLTDMFKALLNDLIESGILRNNAQENLTLEELNILLQQKEGGLLRKPGLERWHLKDPKELEALETKLDHYFDALGFVQPELLKEKVEADYAFVHGGLVTRMNKRLKVLLNLYQNNLLNFNHLFLFGSNRKLAGTAQSHETELEGLKKLIEEKAKIDPQFEADNWRLVFNDPEQATEDNAFHCLFEMVLPQDLQKELDSRTILMDSKDIGGSFNLKEGWRPTGQTGATDWMKLYDPVKPHTYFSAIERPYQRIVDQHRWTIWSDNGKASLAELQRRMAKDHFITHIEKAPDTPLRVVVLDEIARNVFNMKNRMTYLQKIFDEAAEKQRRRELKIGSP